MNSAGIPGGVVLTSPIQVFRCGIELECVPREPEIIPDTTPVPVPPVIPPEPFPLQEVVSFALGIILGPSIVAVCFLVLYCVQKKKSSAELAVKREESKKAFKVWIDEKESELNAMSGKQLGVLFERFEQVEVDAWKEEEMHSMVPEMAKYFYRIETGLGSKPEGIYRHVPLQLFAPGKPAKPAAPVPQKKGKGKGKNEPEEVLKLEEPPAVTVTSTANIESAEDGANGENGEDGGKKKKKGRKRTEAKEDKILWIKRAEAAATETHEEVAV